MALLDVYVPKLHSPSCANLKPHTAIVGAQDQSVEGDRIHIYFEGNVYNAENQNLFFERVKSAAGRLVQRYPTTAMLWAPAAELLKVATYETDTWSFVDVLDGPALAEWANEDLAHITGVKLPVGEVTWIIAAEALVNASPIPSGDPSRSPMLHPIFRSIAGQYFLLDANKKSAEVLAPDDARIPSRK